MCILALVLTFVQLQVNKMRIGLLFGNKKGQMMDENRYFHSSLSLFLSH